MTENETVAQAAATRFREDNGLGIAPIADVVALIEQTQDVDVTVLDVVDDDEHGLTMVDPEREVTVVAVARSDKPMRWRSTLAHELGHLIFKDHASGEPATLTANAPVESRAQTFARHLLLPAGAVESFVAQRGMRDLATLSDLVQRYQVSPAVAAIQLCKFGYIDQARFKLWRNLYTPSLASRFGWMDHYRALQAESCQRRSPQRLLARAVAGYVVGVVTLETLAGIRGIAVADLAAELDEAGIVPQRSESGASATNEADLDAGEFIDVSWLDGE